MKNTYLAKLIKMIKITVWSGPRNISTALMRSFGNRMDTFVSDEPLYGYFLYNSHSIIIFNY